MYGETLSVLFLCNLTASSWWLLGDALFPALTSLTIEPLFLALFYAGLSNSYDKEIARLCTRGHSADATFVFGQAGEFSLLYHVALNGSLQLIIPGSRSLRKLLMSELHCSTISAHLGTCKTIRDIYLHVWWPWLVLYVVTFVHSCDTCQYTKGRTTAPTSLLALLPIPASKFEQWTIDFIGPLPLCPWFNSIYVIIDNFYKLTRLVPCYFRGDGDLTVLKIAVLFYNNIVHLFGMPKSVLHDRGSRFTSRFLREVGNLMGSKVIFSSAFHPETDGLTERANKIVMLFLRAVLKEQKSDWVSALPAVHLVINSTLNDSMGFSPFFIVYGLEAMKPADLMLGFNRNPGAEGFENRVVKLYETVKTRLFKVQAIQKC